MTVRKTPTAAKPKRKHVRTRGQSETVAKAAPRNKLFPGRDNYTGPANGWFAMLHHEQLFEHTDFGGGYSSVQDRVSYVKSEKPSRELPVRLKNMMYLGDIPQLDALTHLIKAKQVVARGQPDLDYELRRPIEQAIEAHRRHTRPIVLAYIKKHFSDNDWDEKENKVRGT